MRPLRTHGGIRTTAIGVGQIGSVATQALNAPVIGYATTTTQTKKNKVITKTSSVNVRAWEVAALALVAVAGLAVFSWDKSDNGGNAYSTLPGGDWIIKNSPLGWLGVV